MYAQDLLEYQWLDITSQHGDLHACGLWLETRERQKQAQKQGKQRETELRRPVPTRQTFDHSRTCLVSLEVVSNPDYCVKFRRKCWCPENLLAFTKFPHAQQPASCWSSAVSLARKHNQKVGLAGAKGTEQDATKSQLVNCSTTSIWGRLLSVSYFLFMCEGPSDTRMLSEMEKLIWQVLLVMSDSKSKS